MGGVTPYTYDEVKRYFESKNYTLISKEFKNSKSVLEFICNCHPDMGVQTTTLYDFKTTNHNCRKCFDERFKNVKNPYNIDKSQETFRKRHFDKYKNKLFEHVGDEYELLDIYRNNKNETRLVLKHNICFDTYDVSPYKFFVKKSRCQNKECKHQRKTKQRLKTDEQFHKEVFDLYGDEYKILSKYTGKDNKIKILHTICGRVFEKSPNNFLRGQLCTHCVTPSKGEKRIITFLEDIGIKYNFQYKYHDLFGDIDQLSYDFYLPDFNLLIEYQGEYHDGTLVGRTQTEEEFKRRQRYDNKKRQYAIDNNIGLLEIWYWNFENIEDIIASRLDIKKSA